MSATMIYTIPTTGAQIVADILANATLGFPELRDAIEAGTPLVRVEVTSDGYGNARATIVAGIRLLSGGFVPAHLTGPDADDHRFAQLVNFHAEDGRLSTGENARRALARLFAVSSDVRIEWMSYGH